jgi:hypothetical protein
LSVREGGGRERAGDDEGGPAREAGQRGVRHGVWSVLTRVRADNATADGGHAGTALTLHFCDEVFESTARKSFAADA